MLHYLVIIETENDGMYVKCTKQGKLDVVLADEVVDENNPKVKGKRGRKPKTKTYEPVIKKTDDGKWEINPWVVFNEITDVDVLEKALEIFEPKGIRFDRKIKDIITDMFVDGKLRRLAVDIDGTEVEIFGVKVKAYTRNYITMNII